jgi:hypothetical protein
MADAKCLDANWANYHEFKPSWAKAIQTEGNKENKEWNLNLCFLRLLL